MRFYHTTSPEAAEKILAEGFRDSTKTYFTAEEFTGVWLSDVPVSEADMGVPGNTVLIVDLELPQERFDYYEWVREEATPGEYREWLIPAQLINENASLRFATEEEIEAASIERFSQ